MIRLSIALSCISLALGLAACSKAGDGSETRGVASHPLLLGAGDPRDVGRAQISQDERYLYVRYELAADAELKDAHVCLSAEEFGWRPSHRCPYQVEGLAPGASRHTFTIPLTDAVVADACRLGTAYLQIHARLGGASTRHAYAGTFKGSVAHAMRCPRGAATVAQLEGHETVEVQP